MTKPLTGDALIAHAEANHDKPKAEIVSSAGYVRPDGRPSFTAYYEALLLGRGTEPAPSWPGGIPRTAGDGPAIYAACLASYNAGHLFGFWLDLSDGPDADDIREAIDAILKESPAPDAEEYAIHDSQFLPGILARTEWPDIDDIAAYCEVWAELSEDDREPYRILCDDAGEILTVDGFHERYWGSCESPESFAEDYADEQGLIDATPEPIRHCIDWESYWRNLDCDGWCATRYGAQYIITRNV